MSFSGSLCTIATADVMMTYGVEKTARLAPHAFVTLMNYLRAANKAQ